MKDKKALLQLWRIYRNDLRNKVIPVEDERLIKTPPGLANNVLWIFGHILRSRDYLILRLGGEKTQFPVDLDPLFMKGSSPKNWTLDGTLFITEQRKMSIFDLKKEFLLFDEEQFAFLTSYVENNWDKPFAEPYTTSTGYPIDSVGNAAIYNIIHESHHIGQLQIYLKLLS